MCACFVKWVKTGEQSRASSEEEQVMYKGHKGKRSQTREGTDEITVGKVTRMGKQGDLSLKHCWKHCRFLVQHERSSDVTSFPSSLLPGQVSSETILPCPLCKATRTLTAALIMQSHGTWMMQVIKKARTDKWPALAHQLSTRQYIENKTLQRTLKKEALHIKVIMTMPAVLHTDIHKEMATKEGGRNWGTGYCGSGQSPL
jgi:hypothetical protein